MKRLGLALVIVTSAVAAEAQAGRSWIFGMDSADVAVSVPSRMCAFTGQTIRFRPDVLDALGNRLMLPMNSFIWRYTRANGLWNQWDSRFSQFFYPFRMSANGDSVLIEVTRDMGAKALLQMVAPSHAATQLTLVDGDREDADCSWGPRSIYIAGRTPPDSPPIVPPGDNVLVCGDTCLVGAKCGDRCPSSASCEVALDKSGKIKFHKVLACHADF